MEATLGIRVSHRRMGLARDLLASAYLKEGRYAEARKAYADVIEYSRQWGDEWALAMILINAGRTAMKLGDFDRAEALTLEALPLHRRVGQTWSLIKALADRASLDIWLGLYDEALARLDEARQLQEQSKNYDIQIYLCTRFGFLRLAKGKTHQARHSLKRALNLGRNGVMSNVEALEALELIAWLLLERGDPESCLRLMAAISANRTTTGLVAPPVEKTRNDQHISQAKNRLSDPVASMMWAQGSTMSINDAILFARTLL